VKRLLVAAGVVGVLAVSVVLVGVLLQGTGPNPHHLGAALVAAGTAALGACTVGAFFAWAQLHIDDERAHRERKAAAAAGLELTLRTQVDLPHIDLSRIDLRDRYLPGRDFSGGTFGDADLSGANLARTRFVGADLTGARLVGADLSGADLTRADLIGVDLTAATLDGAVLTDIGSDGTTRWPEGHEVDICPEAP
jgi:uncharacterized protein YjbI with pentapeptide repeats